MVQLIRQDLQFILNQILLAESGQLPPTAFHPWGLRQVNGMNNHIIPGQETWGAADQNFIRLLTPVFRDAGIVTVPTGLPGQPFGSATSYTQTIGYVFDPQLRVISNLIVDQTANNPAAVEANGGAPTAVSPGLDGIFGVNPITGLNDDRDVFFIPNIAPDEGLSAPFNSWFTFFGQFFDHGLDLVNKGGSGTVIIPLQADDPLYDFGANGVVDGDDGFGADGVRGTPDDSPNFMQLTRATNRPGADGILGTADDVREHNNQTTPFIDQNQTYTSHSSHQVFLREYALNASNDAVSTGRFLDGAEGGLAKWSNVKAQAASMLGVLLSDHDIHNVPLLKTDDFGRFIPGANGFAQIGVRVGNGADGFAGTADDDIVYVEGVAGGLNINDPAAVTAALIAAGSAVTVGTVVRINHAFLDDIAHHAAPGVFDHDANPFTPRINQTKDADVDLDGDGVFDFTDVNANNTFDAGDIAIDTLTDVNGDGFVTSADFFANDRVAGTYDNEMLDAHFITGDGRGNENIGLTAVHTIFHSEHNRLVGAIKDEVSAILATDGVSDFVRGWVLTGADLTDGIQENEWNGERLFQAARVFTEMQYQHLVFEEFARKIQPNIDIFINIDMTINPAIFAEFAHVVYRFGHSMLTETVDRFDADFSLVNSDDPLVNDAQQIGLIAAFLNPLEFVASGADAAAATSSIIRGLTRQSGNAIDEFVTEALRNNLVGLPLDLPVLNLARGRDTGVPSLNEARRQFFALTGDSKLTPYISWVDFALNVKHPASVMNFIAGYGTHVDIVNATTLADKRAVALALVERTHINSVTGLNDSVAFLNATGAYAGGSLGGLNDVDLWIGGLAELPPAFGGMLGSTFGFVFETQMENLQNGDRFYYLARFSGQNFLSELEGNSFASLIMRNTDLKHLPGDVFATPTWTLEVDQSQQFTGLTRGAQPVDRADPTWADEGLANNPYADMVLRDDPATEGPDTHYLRYNGVGHVVLGGTENADTLIAGIGDDTIWGDGGNDRIEGGNGADILNGGDGDDIITDLAFDDNIKGGDGNDVIHSGNGIDLVLGGRGNDFINIGTESGEAFAGLGNDFVKSEGTLIGLVGGFGDDWLEAGFGNSFLTGDNADVDGSVLNFADNDPSGGHDVLINRGGPTDFDSFGGDDIMVGGAGTERYEGFIGFDWGSFQNNGATGAEADMAIRPVPHPGGDPNATLDRFDNTEGLSGSAFADILRGDDRGGGATLVGHELTAAGIARIDGMQAFLGAAGAGANNVVDGDVVGSDDMFNGGNIILGGAGSDLIEGRGGNDIIDGDAQLRVAIGVDRDNDGDFEGPTERANWMSEIEAEMLSGALNPGQLGIVREIIYSATTDTDTALYTGNREDYFIEGEGVAGGIGDVDGDGFIRVSHLVRDAQGIVVLGQLGIDGSDLLRNIERLQFNDAVIQVGDSPNLGPVGRPTINDTSPAEGQTLTADYSLVTDPNNTATGGAINTLVTITWQMFDAGANLWTDILVPGAPGSEVPIPATGPTFTVGQEQANSAIRVRMNYLDQFGVLENAVSLATAPATPINDLPVGALLISDPTPTETVAITAIVAFTDADGTHGAVFSVRWQSSANGLNGWADIVGATAQNYTPVQADVGRFLRAIVTYEDDFGTTETVTSASTGIVGDFIDSLLDNETITGTNGDDWILGNAGNDVINGGLGADVLEGGIGGDRLNGQDGNDILLGGAGNDNLNGGAGNDTLTGGAGNDVLNGGIVGGAGNDLIIYNIGDGADTMDGGLDTDTLRINGTANADTLDVVINGVTTIEGGSVSNIEVVNANLQGGVDTLSYAATLAAVSISVNLTTATATGFTSLLNIENVVGGLGADTIVGSGGANVLTGLAGADNIDGAKGDDFIVATDNDGNDAYAGGQGFDVYDLSNTAAAATVNLALGTSTSAATGIDTLNGVEGVIGSALADTLTGDANANFLNGDSGGDTLHGGGGADTLIGGLGADRVNGDAGDDTIIYNLGAGALGDGNDVQYDGGANNDTLRIIGSNGANTLGVVWNGAALASFGVTNLISIESVTADLRDGSDRLNYAGTLAAFGVTVNLLAGTASGFTNVTNIENVTGGAGDDNITGSSGANDLDGGLGLDTLNGGDGNDNLSGGGGEDVLIGGLGDDIMNGGGANDRFVFSGLFGNDSITGFDENPGGGQDKLDISALAITADTFAAQVAIVQSGVDVLITINGQTITLQNENVANYNATDFLLAI